MGISKKQVQKMFLFSFSSSRSLFFATAAAAATPVAKDRGNETGSLSLSFLSLSLSRCARARLESLLIKRPGVGGSIGWGWGKKSDFSMNFSVGGSRFFFNQRRILF